MNITRHKGFSARRIGAALLAGCLPIAAVAADGSPDGALGRAIFGDDFGKSDKMKIGGWLEAGFVYNKDKGKQVGLGNSPTILARDSGLQLNQTYIYWEKAINTNVIPRVTPTPAPMAPDAAVGFHVDAMYGRDAQAFQTAGWDDKWGINNPGNQDPAKAAANRQSFLTVPQAYVQFYLPVGLGVSGIVGNFMSEIVSTEIGFHPQPGPNIFYTHTYALASEPIKHTGLLLAANVMKNASGLLAAEFGIVRGWSNFKDNNSKYAYLGSLRYRTPNMATWVDYNVISGPAQNSPGYDVQMPTSTVISPRDQNQTQQTLSITHHIDQNWTVKLGADQGKLKGDGMADTINILTGPVFKGASWNGVHVQVQYKISPTLSVAGRTEKFHDPDGLGLFPNNGGPIRSDYTESTVGLQWWALKNLLVRPELRFDRQSNYAAKVFNGGKDASANTFNVDAIFYF